MGGEYLNYLTNRMVESVYTGLDINGFRFLSIHFYDGTHLMLRAPSLKEFFVEWDECGTREELI